jgi:hypothetical protein
MMNLFIQPDSLNNDQDKIGNSLQSRLTLLELFAILLVVGLTVVFSVHHKQGFYQPWDFKQSYLPAGAGDYSNFFYGYWFMPIFWLLEKIPFSAAYLLWSLLNVFGIFFASRVFGGRTWLALLSYQMVYVIFYGQITGIMIGGLALAWWGMKSKKYHLAGLGFLIASVKMQLGLPLSVIIWLLEDLNWKERSLISVVPLLGLLVTFLLYPDWVQNILLAIQSGKVDRLGDISLWRFVGPWSLIFFIIPFIVPFDHKTRKLSLIAASLFALPYVQQTGLLILLVFPFGWLSLLGNLGFLFPFLEWELLSWFFLIPLAIYLMTFFHFLLGSKPTPGTSS